MACSYQGPFSCISVMSLHLFPFRVSSVWATGRICMGVGYGKADREPLECCAWQELLDMQSIWAQYIVKVQKWGIGNNLWGHFQQTISWRHCRSVPSKLWFMLWPWWNSLGCTRPCMSKKVISIILNIGHKFSHFWSGDTAQMWWTVSMLCLWMLVVASSTFLWNSYKFGINLMQKCFSFNTFTWQ
jgi:hypothetical protein